MIPDINDAPAAWLVRIRGCLPVLAWVGAGLLVLRVIAEYALTPLYYLFADSHLQEFTDVWFTSSEVVWWAWVATSCALAAGIASSWRPASALERRALGMAGLGLLLAWSWWLVHRSLTGWLYGAYGQEPDGPPTWLLWLGTGLAILHEVLDLIAAGLLVASAVRWRRDAGHAAAGSPGGSS